MLHLKTGVHFDEIELAVFIKELDGAGTAIFELAHGVGADFADLHALFDGQCRRIGFFQHLLVTALQRAIAFAKVNGIAFTIAENLHFDMARLAEIFFHVDGVVAEGCCRFGTGSRNRLFQIGLGLRHLHAATTAARRRLDEDWEADRAGNFERVFRLHFAIRAGNDGNAEILRRLLGGDLVAHDADMFGGRSDEGDAVCVENIGELGIFRQEAVTGVNRVRTCYFAGRNDLVDVEVAVTRGRRADANAFVGKAHMHGVCVGRGMYGYRRNAELFRGAQDA
ncbi:hypothetical protein D3C86_1194820 [compost metagenome]